MQSNAQRAVNVNVTRETVRATVESIKGEVSSGYNEYRVSATVNPAQNFKNDFDISATFYM